MLRRMALSFYPMDRNVTTASKPCVDFRIQMLVDTKVLILLVSAGLSRNRKNLTRCIVKVDEQIQRCATSASRKIKSIYFISESKNHIYENFFDLKGKIV